jgi:alanyl-tRNA synthetase
MRSEEVRRSFLDFFSSRRHGIVKSSSLLPGAPNLLFTNAGMNQFVPVFTGEVRPPFARVADTQKCIRAGGKHNDLDDVGFDTYHHTFFEMLGNWSFGDYFKEEAIEMAWELLTKVWKFPKDRLYATVYSPKSGEPAEFDRESYDLWKKIFVRENMNFNSHLIEGSKRDNFWMMGDTGPCGPCTEIHMDLTPLGDTNGSLVNGESPLCIELWNLVFIQFNALSGGIFEPLKDRYVDTGIGLERVVGIFAKTRNFSDFSNLPSNYDSDLFDDIFSTIGKMCSERYGGTIPKSRVHMTPKERADFWFRAIADHARTLAFAIADGIFPSNEGRGYVLRRILRRAVMFGRLLGLPHGFFTELSAVVVGKMGGVFAELVEQKSMIEKVLRNEEVAFSRTIDRGIVIFNEICARSSGKIIGEDAFLLYDTYGFPLDLTQLMAGEIGMTVDIGGFEVSMESQRSRARGAQRKSIVEISKNCTPETEFVGYDVDNIEDVAATVIEVVNGPEKTFLILDRTPFYAECGGQVSDVGTIRIGEKTFSVVGVQKSKGGSYLHELGEPVASEIVGMGAVLSVDKATRRSITRNHSATHILHFALRKILGNHVKQAGSFVDGRRLRFDFNAISAPTDAELESVEKLVEEKILDCATSNIFQVSFGDIPEGCIANFGEKYGDVVRVVELGDFSMELCAGCHVENTSEIACFKVVSSSAIAAGVRRIEAVTGQAAFDLLRMNCTIVERQCEDLCCRPDEILARMKAMVARVGELEKTAKAMRRATLHSIATEIAETGRKENGLVRVEKHASGLAADELRIVALGTLDRVGEGIVILTTDCSDKRLIVACCSKSAVTAGHDAAAIVKEFTTRHGGSGGGRREFASGGYAL